jgi:hypothetical protein
MAFTAADLERIDRAIAKGELEVEYADRKVRYRSIPELIAARSEISKGIAAADPAPRSRIVRLRHAGKGVGR